jgi:uncharacterized protein YegJ (DUF2314 family)
MKNVTKTILGVLSLGVLLMLPGVASVQFQTQPVVKRLSTYRGDTFPRFSEFRVQDVEFDQLGMMTILSPEPYDLLVNVNYITKVHRYEDSKKTDWSTLMYFEYQKQPLLARMTYKEVFSAIRRASEGQVK